jgi:ABC-type uncharacterized transport system ATPase subunit
MRNILLRTSRITKHFGGIQALKGIDLEIFEGEICALVGENGAGKCMSSKGFGQIESKAKRWFWYTYKPFPPFHQAST